MAGGHWRQGDKPYPTTMLRSHLSSDADGRFAFKGIPPDQRVIVFTFPPKPALSSWSTNGGDPVGYEPGEEKTSIPPTGWKDVPAGITGLEIVLGKEPGLKAYRP